MPEDTSLPFYSARELMALGRRGQQAPPCTHCGALACAGWESVPGGFDAAQLRCLGTLRPAGDEDPTLLEYHPQGTHAWSADAPIAPGWFPYNRCDVWACTTCGRPYLRYTEYGGYYTDPRIRALHPDLVVAEESGG